MHKNIEYINWIIIAIGLIGAYLNLKKKRSGFFLWIVADIYLAIYNLCIEEYPQSVLMTVYLGLALWGFFKWTKQDVEKEINTSIKEIREFGDKVVNDIVNTKG